MKQVIFEIKNNKPLNAQIMEMTLAGDNQGVKAGQFINIKIDGFYLRRPISVCEIVDGGLKIIYKIVGKGTEVLSRMKTGEKLDVLIGLGNGYDLTLSGDKPLLIGGGVGVPPMYELCKQLIAQGKQVTVILGFNAKSEIFYEKEFENLGAKVLVTTADGSYGIKGFVTDAMKGLDYSYFYTCGPEPMLKAVHKQSVTDGEMSFEERMGCGFGACMGCSCKTLTGNKRICKEGPVLKKGEILW
ncbi:MAG: dihydroorotate dehydrogenase electron transfer subunit [Clostridia bacterium]|nr:dihydroorotate dehydrogenase electron transfer subunit [Clostridia bacterium]